MTVASNLAQRTITALVGVTVLLSAIFYGGEWGTRLFGLVISLGMTWEFATLTFDQKDRRSKKWFLLVVALLVHLSSAWVYQQEFLILMIALITLFGFFVALAGAHALQEATLTRHVQETLGAGFSLFYLVALPLLLPLLYQLSPNWLYFFLFVVWGGDVGAYFGGKAMGKTPLYAAVSPKKTVAGAVSGAFLAVPLGVLLGVYFFGIDGLSVSFISAILVYIASQIGDLCESLLKRGLGAKDSGWILPGHGGMMDRFDGVVFALPVMYTSVILFS